MHSNEGETRDPKTDSGGHKSKRYPIQSLRSLMPCRDVEYVGHYVRLTLRLPVFLQSQQIGQPIGHGQFATVHKAMHILTAGADALESYLTYSQKLSPLRLSKRQRLARVQCLRYWYEKTRDATELSHRQKRIF